MKIKLFLFTFAFLYAKNTKKSAVYRKDYCSKKTEKALNAI